MHPKSVLFGGREGNHVLPPCQRPESNRIHKLIKRIRHGPHGRKEREAPGAQLERQDLGRVGYRQRGPGDSVEGVVDEDDYHDRSAVGLRARARKQGGQHREEDVGQQHPGEGGQEERAAARAFDGEGGGEREEEVPDCWWAIIVSEDAEEEGGWVWEVWDVPRPHVSNMICTDDVMPMDCRTGAR